MSRYKKILVGLSGGIDSAVALALLKEQGWKPIAVFLRYQIWQQQPDSIKDLKKTEQQAQKICSITGVPFFVLDDQVEFKKKVIGYYKKMLQRQLTPNPCLFCNHYWKFYNLFRLAKKKGIRYISTGHYARTRKQQNEYQLLRAKDKTKDQSYFLCLLTQKQLRQLVFPLGDLLKAEVQQMARQYGLAELARVKSSQDLCFVAKKSLPAFLTKEIGHQAGQIQDISGKILGSHQGLWFYTLGQRKGLDLAQGPWFVVKIDRPNNILVVSRHSQDQQLLKKEVPLKDFHLITQRPLQKSLVVRAKIRYNQKLSKAVLSVKPRNIARLDFERPQRAVTPGQWAVCYQQDVCLGGGLITDD